MSSRSKRRRVESDASSTGTTGKTDAESTSIRADACRSSSETSTQAEPAPAGCLNRTQSEHIHHLEADGDCFYRAIELASHGAVTVSAARSRIADGLTQAHYDALTAAFAAAPREYAFMRRVRNLDQLRDRQRMCGSDVGSRICVWADWAQIQLAATIYGWGILVRDTQAGFTMKILPEHSTDPDSREESNQDLDPDIRVMYLHVLRVDGCHYNVVTVDGQALLTLKQVQQSSFGKDFNL